MLYLEKYCLGASKKHYILIILGFIKALRRTIERGLDLIAEKIGEIGTEYKSIGVQITKSQSIFDRLHEKEWLKFLSWLFR